MMEPIGEEIWLIDGPHVRAALGFHYPTRMAVIRLRGNALFIWSPVELTDDLKKQIDALGTVQFIVPPNALHHVFLSNWTQAYPEAEVFAPPGLREKRADIAFTSDLKDEPNTGWAETVDQVVMRGNRIVEEVVFFHRLSGIVLFADLLQKLPRGWYSGWRALVARLDLMTGDEPTVPRKFRVAFADKDAARQALRKIQSWNVNKVVIAHGEPVLEEGSVILKTAFHWLQK